VVPRNDAAPPGWPGIDFGCWWWWPPFQRRLGSPLQTRAAKWTGVRHPPLHSSGQPFQAL